MKQSLSVLARWANIVLIIVTLLSYLSPVVNPDSIFWPISMLGLLYPMLMIGHLVFIFYWLNQRKWHFLFSVACLLVGWAALTKSIGFHRVNTSKPSVRVLSFNVQGARKFCTLKTKKGHPKFNAQEFLDYLNTQAIDIAVVQEFAAVRTNQEKTFAALKAGGFNHYKASGKSPLILSKYPITKTGKLAFVNNINGCIYADLKIGTKIIRVYNIHLRSNQISIIADEVAETGDFRERETWQKLTSMFRGYGSAARIRAKQVEKLGKHIRNCPHPVLVCGDFNDVPQSYAYRQIAKGLQDSFQKKGRGLATTYSGSLPFLRIDYILASPRLEIVEHQTDRKSNYSDHYPIIADIR